MVDGDTDFVLQNKITLRVTLNDAYRQMRDIYLIKRIRWKISVI